MFKIMFPTMAFFSRVTGGKDKTKLNKCHFCNPAVSLCFFEVDDVAALFVVSCCLLCVFLMCLLMFVV